MEADARDWVKEAVGSKAAARVVSKLEAAGCITVEHLEAADRDALAAAELVSFDINAILKHQKQAGALPMPPKPKLYTEITLVGPSALINAKDIDNFQAQASKETRTDWPTILYFRPGESAMPWPPAQLVHPVFGNFCDNLQHTGRVTQLDILLLAKLCEASTEYYETERDRMDAVLPILHNILQVEQPEFPEFAPLLEWGPGKGALLEGNLGGKPDFIVFWQAGLVLVFGEIKNEIGLGGAADPCLQAAMAYYNYWTHKDRNTTNTFRHTCCPALLVEVTGPDVRIHALTFLHRVMVQPLTPLLHVYPAFEHDPEHMRRLVAMLAAVRHASAELQAYYCAVDSGLPGKAPATTGQLNELRAEGVPVLYAPRDDEHDEALQLPYPLQHLEAKEVAPSAQKLVYRVPSEGRIVKFCRRYGEAVHRRWAESECAPELHLCARLPGGFYHVEMEDLSPADGWQMLCALSRKGDPRVQAARDTALSKLHEAHRIGGVHGDAREHNVMVRFTDDNEPEVRFIDFDWSGTDGDEQYPLFMNPSAGWPQGVCGEAVMRQDHDVQMLGGTSQQRQVQARARRATTAVAGGTRPRWVPCAPSLPRINALQTPGHVQHVPRWRPELPKAALRCCPRMHACIISQRNMRALR